MCLTIPGKIVSVKAGKAVADFAGKRRKIDAEIVSVKKGDYVLVYSGQVIEKIPKKRADEMMKGLEK